MVVIRSVVVIVVVLRMQCNGKVINFKGKAILPMTVDVAGVLHNSFHHLELSSSLKTKEDTNQTCPEIHSNHPPHARRSSPIILRPSPIKGLIKQSEDSSLPFIATPSLSELRNEGS